ncbi:hypothetical protein GCM10022233_50140 [Streptomyces shaanxiensis]|uniref:Uncharacterized protein n=1 Tax=Streptomyces shaanxiensis TaxID=653357 RepID=A0ABP7VJ03_9ACTN
MSEGLRKVDRTLGTADPEIVGRGWEPRRVGRCTRSDTRLGDGPHGDRSAWGFGWADMGSAAGEIGGVGGDRALAAREIGRVGLTLRASTGRAGGAGGVVNWRR